MHGISGFVGLASFELHRFIAYRTVGEWTKEFQSHNLLYH